MGIFLIIIALGLGYLLVKLVTKKPAAAPVLIGLFSLGAMVSIIFLSEVLFNLKYSAGGTPTIFGTPIGFVFINYCTVIFFALVPLCIVSTVKICRAKIESKLKFVKATFFISIFVSAIVLILSLLSILSVNIPDLSEKIITELMFRSALVIISSALILVFGIVGLKNLKKRQ